MTNRFWLDGARASAGALFLCTTFVSPLFSQSGKIPEDVLARRAEIVAVGKVVSSRSQWEGNRSRIVTYVTVSVDQYLKGAAGSTITIVAPGGEVDGVGELYSHSVAFAGDEEVVVFAEKWKQGHYRITGGPQGKLRVTRDRVSGKALVGENRTLQDFSDGIRRIVNIDSN